MSTSTSRFTPLVILSLVTALVIVSWLLVVEKISTIEHQARSNTDQMVGRQDSDPSAIPAKKYRWKMVTSWPKNFPGLGMAAENFATAVADMSGGRLTVHVYGGGEIVPAMGVFDAVSLGTAEMGHSSAYYWKGKIPSAPFFTTVPFGMTAKEMNAWLYYGGGLELWREVYEPFNLVPMAAGNTGVQMAGWFNKKINSIEDLKGLKMRIPGVGGEVFNRVGGTAVTLPGSEIFTSLQTGVIDATEWVSPYNDMALGLHQVAKYYYYPGWHEPGPSLELVVNKEAFESLPKDLQSIVEMAARFANQDALSEYVARNALALQDLQQNTETEIYRLPDDVIQALKKASEAYLEELANTDPMTRHVYDSWKAFAENAKEYNRISEQAYINARDL